jgi:hypothetical protein
MEQSLSLTVALLTHTPATLDALLRGLPDAWTLQNEGEKTMTVFDVVGHLVYAERANWLPRMRLMLESNSANAFGRFDRWGHLRECQGKTIADLLDEFARLRSENLADLRGMNLGPEDLEQRGQHPALGTVTLSQLIATWAAHDLTHLHQISRIMAHQYRDAVGPWSAFLGVMKCEGHSS